MKRFLCILLSASLLLCPVLTGCGDKKEEGTSEPAGTEALTPQDSDTMHLNMLFTLIGTPDVGVTELLGDGIDQKYRADGSLKMRTVDGTACGVDITFDVCYDELGDVSSVDVDFPASVSEEQLTATVSELTGRKPSQDGKWQAETAIVSLAETDGHMCMTLKSFSAEPDGEDPVQY